MLIGVKWFLIVIFVCIILISNDGLPGDSVLRFCLPRQETRIRSLGEEDPLEKERQPTPVFLPGKFHEQRNPVGLESQRVEHD